MFGKYIGNVLDDSMRLIQWLLYIITMLSIVLIVLIVYLFLSSRPAGASHGRPGQLISDCCPSTNRASGTSYRVVALVFSPPVQSVFQSGAAPVTYILQWPQLEATTDQYIRLARQRLAVVLAVDAAPKIVRKHARSQLKSQQVMRATGMAFFFGGIMLVATLWGRPFKS